MKRYERLRVNPNLMREDVNLQLLETSNRDDYPKENTWVVLSGRIQDRAEVAVMYYLQEDLHASARHAHGVCTASLEYLFGSWRREVVPSTKWEGTALSFWRTQMPWLYEFRLGLVWSSCLGDWKTVKKLSDYPDDDCVNVGSDFAASDRSWYILLAKRIRGEQASGLLSYEEVISAGTKKKPKLLLDAGRALWKDDASGFNTAIDSYLKYFKISEFADSEGGLAATIALDATLLVHLAERRRLNVSLKAEYEDYIVRIPASALQ